MTQQLLLIEQAAQRLHCHTNTVRNFAKAGLLCVDRDARNRVTFRAADIEALARLFRGNRRREEQRR